MSAWAGDLLRYQLEQQRVDQGTFGSLATIKRRVLSPDGTGRTTETFSTLATNVPCRLDRISLTEKPVSEGTMEATLAIVRQWIVSFAITTTVLPGDVVIVDGNQFECEDTDDARTNKLYNSVVVTRSVGGA